MAELCVAVMQCNAGTKKSAIDVVYRVWSKYSYALIVDDSMMVRFDEEDASGAPFGVCDWDGEPTDSAAA